MRSFSLVFALAAIGALVAIPGTAAQPANSGTPVAAGELSGGVLTVSPKISFDSATLRVAGPAGYEAVTWSGGEPLHLDLLAMGRMPGSDGMAAGSPAVLPDGSYGYEVVFYLSDGERRVHAGSFMLEGGGLRGPGGEREGWIAKGAAPRESSSEPLKKMTAENASEHFLIADDNNDGEANLQILSRTDVGSTINYWGVRNVSGDLRLSTTLGGSWDDHLTLAPNGRLGLGTTVPQADLHIFRPGGNIRITDSDACPNPNAAWEIEEDFGKLMFEVVANCPGDNFGGKMWLTGSGRVGIGTSDPGEEIEVAATFPSVRFNDISETSQVWDIEGNRFDFQVQDVTHGGVAPFLIQPGTPHQTLHLNSTGRVGIGTASPAARLHVFGSGIIEGDVSLGSSRTIKHEIEPVDGGQILEAVRELPLYRWKYQDDPVQAPHVGPMAEDVHAAFRLGRDEKHLSPADSAGLALAAIQELDRELVGLRAENRELAAANDELRERLVRLVESLEAALLPAED